MKTKRAFIAVCVVALIFAIAILAWREAYFVMGALIAGTLLICHRQIWSLIKRKRLPPIDERMRENANKSLRNGFIFFAVASALLMLFFHWFSNLFSRTNLSMAHFLGGLFLAGGVVYILSYLFYDKSEPRLGERELKLLRTFLLVAGISTGAIIISIVLHNAIYGLFIEWFGADFWVRTGLGDEPVFFIIAVIICPLAIAVGLIGSLVIFIKGLCRKAQ